ncbi:AraC family transcriptional regulator [Bailinhaonella thermotolerans]|uniref:AraC family transcriptional regulator n=1 Tax=Bailinhaonella thermotolerans TaxID=1070861 RepID=UPI00192A3627|nr:AraC family transcriptional regulator [Bailinhaonella thermotolerans]
MGPVEWTEGREHWEHWWRYLTPSPAHRRLGLACLGVGTQRGRIPAVGPRVLANHVAVVVLSGEGWFSWGGRPPVDVRAPALLWLIPGVEHHYGPYEPGWSECFVDFTGPAAGAYEELGFIDRENPVVPLSSAEAAEHVVRKMAAICRRGGPHVEVETSAAVHELLVTLRHARADHDPEGHPVLANLARNAFLPLTVTEHARRLRMSVAELRESVRRNAGCSPKDYILSIRLTRAKELLTGTDLGVAAIARRVGYPDPAYFTRVFTRRVGISPTVFRERGLRGPEGL